MSNSLAIATVTATLTHLLNDGIIIDSPGTTVTAKPPEKARNARNNQLNLFLYQTVPNAAWRNMDMAPQVKPGETGQPPLALNLFYLITAYGEDEDDIKSHRLLGKAMSILHDHPLLDATEIRDALADNDLYQQIERVRITPQPMSLEEMSKLWMMFQTQYRISAAYQVAVVLIESTLAVKTPLPVLMRGADDSGVSSQADLIPPFPTLEAIIPINQQPSARLGEELTIKGHHLNGDDVVIKLTNPRLPAAIELTPLPGRTATEIKVQLPNNPAQLPAGFYGLVAVIKRTDQPDKTTNELLFSLAPRILNFTPNPAVRNPSGNVTLTVNCNPEVRLDHRVSLLVGDRESSPQVRTNQSESLVFEVKDIPVGEYFLRLRVDGIDSLLINRGVKPPVFDATQKVIIQ
jgi:Pvc16 N-terminal domain